MDYLRWETDTRYYEARINRDLFGAVVLARYWGGRGTSLGGMLSTPFDSADAALRAVHRIAQVRSRRGYRLTYGTTEQIRPPTRAADIGATTGRQ